MPVNIIKTLLSLGRFAKPKETILNSQQLGLRLMCIYYFLLHAILSESFSNSNESGIIILVDLNSIN